MKLCIKKDSAPGPDGYGACFYQSFWDIIKVDVINAVLQFFNTGWILPNFNANTLVLIPKTPSADTLSQYRPIAMANFKFKILSKMIADRLAQIMQILFLRNKGGSFMAGTLRSASYLHQKLSTFWMQSLLVETLQ